MQVKTRLEIMTILPVLLALIVSGILLWVSWGIDDAVSTFRTANGIAREAFKLSTATYACLREPGPETRKKWEAIHLELGRILSRAVPAGAQDAAILRDIRACHGDIRTALQEWADRSAGTEPSDTAASALFQQVWTRAQTLVEGSFTLAAKGHDQVTALQEMALMSIIGSSAVLAGILAICAVMLSRTLSRGVQSLAEGTRHVAGGHLDFQVRVDTRDELGELATAFNSMTQDLRKAHEVTQAEMKRRAEVAESLRESNCQLSDALLRLTRAQSEMIQQERLKALRQIAGGIVHDLNDALMPIMGFSEYLLRNPAELNDTAAVGDVLRKIRTASVRAADVVLHLSEYFAPTHSGDTEPVDLNPLIRETVSLAAVVKGGNAVSVRIDTELGEVPPVESSAADLKEALSSLLLNAVEAMPEGGRVLLRTRVEGPEVVLDVIDRGVGMEAESGRRCFEPFYSTKGGEHSGMGLTIAQAAIRRCRGSLTVATDLGRGSTFTIRLPLTTPYRPKKIETKMATTKSLRILIVDDEVGICEILCRHLKSEGHSVESAGNGRVALEKLRAAPHDLLITDRAMPEMSGDELVAEVEQMQPRIPVIMLTGFGDAMAETNVMPAGVDVVVSKPMSLDRLRVAMIKALGAAPA